MKYDTLFLFTKVGRAFTLIMAYFTTVMLGLNINGNTEYDLLSVQIANIGINLVCYYVISITQYRLYNSR